MNEHQLKALVANEFEDIVGQERVKKQIKSAILMKRHVILVGPPGIGKTTLVKNISRLLPATTLNDCEYHCSPDLPSCPRCLSKKSKEKIYTGNDLFVRVQGSPDLTAEDLLGDIDPMKALQFGPLSEEAFTPGKIFQANKGILFFDEINRANEKLQNALLQALEERKVTIGSYAVDFPADFILIGTMNPQDASTEPLSSVFLDRFDLVYMSYPASAAEEQKIVASRGQELVTFPTTLLSQVIAFIHTLRKHPDVEQAPSVRATLGLYERAQSNAYLANRTTTTFADVREALLSVVAHRIVLKPSKKFLQSAEAFIREQFDSFASEHGLSEGDVP
ncbi:MAG: ATP-binding protein [Candidatus Woesearchaeota archaeon]|nr:MAG: ATP-binding protein [Candidatus Woesearchaeota archaeon]